jgi:hypothetical protein
MDSAATVRISFEQCLIETIALRMRTSESERENNKGPGALRTAAGKAEGWGGGCRGKEHAQPYHSSAHSFAHEGNKGAGADTAPCRRDQQPDDETADRRATNLNRTRQQHERAPGKGEQSSSTR